MNYRKSSIHPSMAVIARGDGNVQYHLPLIADFNAVVFILISSIYLEHWEKDKKQQ